MSKATGQTNARVENQVETSTHHKSAESHKNHVLPGRSTVIMASVGRPAIKLVLTVMPSPIVVGPASKSSEW